MSAYEMDRIVMAAWTEKNEAEHKYLKALAKYEKLKAEFDKKIEEDQVKFDI